MKIVTMSMHKLLAELKAELDNQGSYWTYLCSTTEHLYGRSAVFAIVKLLEEECPGAAYKSIFSWRSGFSRALWYMKGGCPDKNSDELRREFVNKLLSRPDRQLVWMEIE